MDNNNPTNPTPPAEAPIMPVTEPPIAAPSSMGTLAQTPTEMPMGEPTPPAPPPPGGLPPELPTSEHASGGGHGKMFMMVGIVVLLIALIGGGWYFYSTNMASKPTTQQQGSAGNVEGVTELQDELEEVKISDPEADLKEVDTDITLLEATGSAR